jgi:hypothetical protein
VRGSPIIYPAASAKAAKKLAPSGCNRNIIISRWRLLRIMAMSTVRVASGVMTLAGLLAMVSGGLMLVGLQDQLSRLPAVVVVPQLILAAMTAGFGATVVAVLIGAHLVCGEIEMASNRNADRAAGTRMADTATPSDGALPALAINPKHSPPKWAD